MWRQNNAFPGNPDSDQSISEEEDSNGDSLENCVSLTRDTEKKEGLQIQSRFEVLRGAQELSCGWEASNLARKKQASFLNDDEVEIPDFPDDGGFTFHARKKSVRNVDEEVISDSEDVCTLAKHSITSSAKRFHKDSDHHDLGSGEQDVIAAWSIVGKEAEGLINLNENAVSSTLANSKAKRSSKGVRGKCKPKYYFHFQSHKDRNHWPSVFSDGNAKSFHINDGPEKSELIGHGNVQITNSKLPEGVHGENENKSVVVAAKLEAVGHGFMGHSMAERLDSLQDNSFLLRGNSKSYCRTGVKRAQLLKRNISSLGDRITDVESQADLVPGGLSSDDEASYAHLKCPNPVKRQNMADKFQEALAATSMSYEGAFVTAPKLSGIGLFGKLQQVMHNNKERDIEFLRKHQLGASLNDEPCSIIVKILSRYFDAKLTVCQCSNMEDSRCPESSHTLLHKGMKKTVIFSPRICSDVELEVGKLVRIHPPWKEVQVMGNDASIILSAYFSQI